jgi:hypothetical protein
VPRTYIKLLRDRTIRPAQQDRMIANLGDAHVLQLDAGHDAMLSQPAELAALIDLASHQTSPDARVGAQPQAPVSTRKPPEHV